MRQNPAGTANLQLVKETNLALIFELVYHCSPISRAELAARTHLSPTTVSSLVDELRQKNLVAETGAVQTASSGRKPIMLAIQGSGAGMIALELFADSFKCCLYNLLCEKIGERSAAAVNCRDLGAQMADLSAQLLQECGFQDQLLGISLAVPGLIDQEQERVISSTVVPVDSNFDLLRDLKLAFPGVPVILENESSLCAYAEKAFGRGKELRNLVYLDINRGIGGGIILENRLYRGSWGIAGEAGHISIDCGGPQCRCGNYGCLEIMAGILAVWQLTAEAISHGRATLLWDMTAGDLSRLTFSILGQALDQCDETAREITATIARRLACGANSIANLFNPDLIVIGGEICCLGNRLFDPLNEYLARIALKAGRHHLTVTSAAVKEDAALLGGARYVLDTVFKRPAVFGNF